jgi:apolipoprotein N-acyltransferase
VTIVVGVVEGAGNLALSILPSGNTVNYLKWHDTIATKGHQLVSPSLAGAKLGVEVCADVDFTDPSRAYAQGGTQLLAISASDEGADGLEHANTAQLRGVENGLGVAWADRNGEMLVADGFGNVVAKTDSATAPGQFAVLTAAIPPNPGTTLYTRLGDWFGWFCLGLALLGLISSFIPRPAREPAPSQKADSLVGSGQLG